MGSFSSLQLPETLFLYHRDSCLKVTKLMVTGDQGSDAESSKMTNPNMFRTVVTASGSPYCGVRLHEKTLELPKKDEIVDCFYQKNCCLSDKLPAQSG